MILTVCSFVMATLWFTAFILLGAALQRKSGILFCCQLAPLLLLLTLTALRMVVPVEFLFTQPINITVIYPTIQRIWNLPLFTLGGWTVTVLSMVLGLWGLVTLILCGRLALRIRRDFIRLNALRAMPCGDVRRTLSVCRSRGKHAQPVKLIVSPDVSTPMVAGFFSPVILLPSACDELEEPELTCVLSHELAHLHSHDLWVKLIVQFLCCVMWWNPCVHLLRRSLDNALEFKCDLTATSAMSYGEKIKYLEVLLDVLSLPARQAETQTQMLQASFSVIAEPPVLKQRFELVLERPNREKRPSAIAFMVAVTLLFALSYFFVLQPASYPPPEDLEHEVIISPETSYILKAEDGSHHLVYENEVIFEITPDMIDVNPFPRLTIYTETKED